MTLTDASGAGTARLDPSGQPRSPRSQTIGRRMKTVAWLILALVATAIAASVLLLTIGST